MADNREQSSDKKGITNSAFDHVNDTEMDYFLFTKITLTFGKVIMMIVLVYVTILICFNIWELAKNILKEMVYFKLL